MSVLLELVEEGSACVLGGSVGEFIHSKPWEFPWVSSDIAHAQRAGQLLTHPGIPQDCAHNNPYRKILLLLIWAISVRIVGVTLKWVWLSRKALAQLAMSINIRGEEGGSWVAPFLLSFAQHHPVMALMMCSVSPRCSSRGCSFLVIVPQCQSLLAWQHPLHLSAASWAEHNQNPCVMESFPVS